ncbi:flagellar motor switch protein FliN [Nitrosophilus kaiyonis]|uniref:flagellar motor switch protein FliN n=1 Tax=Nitrosophilus kaiyonis TaxID=2930200 RepID=UPI0024923EA3|nr:flagellar motor switch protein FliN [Nitrosophilus kaiyonis]
MSEEIKNNQDSVDQEELAKEWAEQAEQDNQENSQEVDQDELAAQWEAEAAQENNQEDLASSWESEIANEDKKPIDSSLESFENYEKSENSKLSLLMDIPLEVTVEIGSTELPIEEILKLNPNSVIELDKMISEPVDLKVNGKLIAKGELYTIKNSFGIKITNIITPEDRMKILDSE